MKTHNLKILPFLILLFIFGCKHDPTEMPDPGGGVEPCDTLNVTYQSSVFPILQQHCISCHGGTTPEAGLNFENYDNVAFIAHSGQLLGSIRHEANYSPMPQGLSKLKDCDITKIEIWVRDTTFTEPPGSSCDPDTIYFQNTILPLLQSSCGIIGCHDPGTATAGVILTNFENIMASDILEPGKPGDSELYEKITEDDPNDIMPPPPSSSLTEEQRNAVFKWIEQSAFNNYCEESDCDTINVTYTETIWPIIQGRCFGCHNGPNTQSGILLENYVDIVASVNSGRFLGAIKHEESYSAMPQNGAKLPDCNIIQIQKWINDGTPNN